MRAPFLLFALVLAACQSAPDTAATEMLALEEAMPATEASRAAADGAGTAPVEGAPAVGRELIRTGTLEIRARDHVEAVERTREWTRALGGTVTGEESARYATRVETRLTLRVPAARFDTLMTVLAATSGDVERRAVRVDDVTRPVADTEARLRVRRAAEARLVELLDDAERVEDVLAIQTRLDAVREEIESAEAQLRALRTDVALSTVHATIYQASAAGVAPGERWGRRAARALGAGWDGLLESFLVAAALWPLWLVLAALGWVWRSRRRRAAVREP